MFTRLWNAGQEAIYTTLAVALLGGKAAQAVTTIGINTGKRILGMTTPSTGINETIEVLDAGFATAIRLRTMLSEGSPGGKKATLDELLSAVTDGEMKQSISNLVDAVEQIAKSKKVDAFALIPTVVEALLDFLKALKVALEDGRVGPNEILHGITDGDLRPELSRAVEGVDKIPAELKGMDMMKMFTIFTRITSYLPRLTEPVTT